MDISRLKESYIRSCAQRDRELECYDALSREVTSLYQERDVHQKALEVLKTLLQDLVGGNLKTMDSLITDGLRRVFYDQPHITFTSEIVEKQNQLQIQFVTSQGSASGDALKSFGASVTVVESLLLRIFLILKMNLHRTILMDEALVQVSEEYVENLGNLIRTLCEDLGFDILLITHHQQGFQDASTTVYRVDCDENDVRTMSLKRLKG